MKKLFIFLLVITIVSVFNDFQTEEVIIPKESIRFRVIANTDKEEDQDLKQKVKENLNKDIEKILMNQASIESTRETIKNSIPMLQENINKTLKENNSNMNYDITYGENYFPTKEYKNVIYKEGKYESLVVKLGKGEGQNFWCVLFPPLCFIDEEEENQDVEYHLLVKDIINKFSSKISK